MDRRPRIKLKTRANKFPTGVSGLGIPSDRRTEYNRGIGLLPRCNNLSFDIGTKIRWMSLGSHLGPGVPDHVCGLLCDHHDRCDGIAIRHDREYRCIRDSNVRHTAHSKFRVHHGCRIVIGTHLAGPSLVVFGPSRCSHVALPVSVAGEVVAAKKRTLRYFSKSKVIFVVYRQIG